MKFKKRWGVNIFPEQVWSISHSDSNLHKCFMINIVMICKTEIYTTLMTVPYYFELERELSNKDLTNICSMYDTGARSDPENQM